MIKDEFTYEFSPFGESFREMAGYYNNRLQDLRTEMAARKMAAPDYVDFEIIPKELRQEDRSRRHDRDYCIIRDTQRVLIVCSKLFEDLYKIATGTL
jgi:hypothetical protein